MAGTIGNSRTDRDVPVGAPVKSAAGSQPTRDGHAFECTVLLQTNPETAKVESTFNEPIYTLPYSAQLLYEDCGPRHALKSSLPGG